MKTAGLIFLSIGIISIIIQNTFFGYVDANGVLHDSLFLPVGALATLLGAGLLVLWSVIKLFRKVR
jgi:hypothetical protein